MSRVGWAMLGGAWIAYAIAGWVSIHYGPAPIEVVCACTVGGIFFLAMALRP